jgi:hypothetical protein
LVKRGRDAGKIAAFEFRAIAGQESDAVAGPFDHAVLHQPQDLGTAESERVERLKVDLNHAARLRAQLLEEGLLEKRAVRFDARLADELDREILNLGGRRQRCGERGRKHPGNQGPPHDCLLPLQAAKHRILGHGPLSRFPDRRSHIPASRSTRVEGQSWDRPKGSQRKSRRAGGACAQGSGAPVENPAAAAPAQGMVR